jgi:AcrR family transcriptional regulator
MTVGRKRAFDKAVALDQAMRVFWRNGYSGTSMSDLTSALGINKPSLYAAFGNKEQLFAAALEHYMSQYGAPLLDRLEHPVDAPLSERLRAYLLGVVALVSDKASPTGCFFVKSSCESGGEAVPEEISATLQDMGLANERALTHYLEVERQRGQLPPEADSGQIAGYLLSVLHGLSVLARRGKPRAELEAVVDLSIKALPIPEP